MLKKVVQAQVIKSTGNQCLVKTIEGQFVPCLIRGKLRLSGSKSTNPVVVGDMVEIEFEADHEQASISRVFERKNYIVRKSVNLSKQSHVIASNIDQAVIVACLKNPKTSNEFVDRFLCTSEAYKIPAKIIFNKYDIYGKEEILLFEELKLVYEKLGYKCIAVSVYNNYGMDEFKAILKNKVSLISGNSGVGKSSIINSLNDNLNLRVSEISDYHHKGKHTTTFSEMCELPFGGYVIDTPGIKGFGVINIENKELFHYFPEMINLVNECKFYNCTHVNEPNCAVKLAVEKNEIALSRYISYLNILDDSNNKHRE